ncbi:cysteine desulfurase-like protein [Ensifer adhaerens]
MAFPISRVRAEFPSLSLADNGQPRIYLDNSAGTQVPQRVINAVSDCFLRSNANQGGFFHSSVAANKVVDDAHQAMAGFLGSSDPGEIIIGASSTALNFQMSRSICRDFQPGDEIIVTRMDHEGNVAPWLEIASDKGLVIRWVGFDSSSWQIEPEALRGVINERTRLLALNYASNLTGAINDVAKLVQVAKTAGVMTYVDAVQLAPHQLIDVTELGCDFLVCSPYKFFGPHLGVLWGKRALLEKMHAYKCRCVPEVLSVKFEVGTPPYRAVGRLESSDRPLRVVGKGTGSYSRHPARRHYRGICGKPGVRRPGRQSFDRGSVVDRGYPDRRSERTEQHDGPRATISFRHDRIAPVVFSRTLSNQNICIRSGHSYAMGIVAQLGIPEGEGVVRIGLAHYNTIDEVDQCLKAIKAVAA